MVDPTKKTELNKSDVDRDRLLNKIDELEKLLTKKKPEIKPDLPLKSGADGIPVLVKTIEKDNQPSAHTSMSRDDELINKMADKIEQQVSQKIDKLIAVLKNDIINEVKAHLLRELQTTKK